MNVVVVSEWLPYPATSGGKIRTLNLVVRLAERHRVRLLCRGSHDTETDADSVRYLAERGITTTVVDQPPPAKHGLAFHLRLAMNLLSSKPYAVAGHDSPLMHAAVQQVAREESVDLWQFEWMAYLGSLRRRPHARTILMAPNVESLIWQRYCEHEPRSLHRWYLQRQWHKFADYEAKAFHAATRVVTVSDEDCTLARDRYAADNVAVVENGIDRVYYEAASGTRQPRRVLFLGSLDWRPNLDAVDRLLEHVWPLVRAQEPEATMQIVGRAPPARLARRVEEASGVTLHPDVPDVRPYLAESSCLAVPLRIGGGSRLKIIEALATGLPVVSTAVGAEGLGLTPAEHFTLAESNDELAEAIVATLRSPVSAREQAARGKRFVCARYDWDVLARKLERVWYEVAEQVPATL